MKITKYLKNVALIVFLFTMQYVYFEYRFSVYSEDMFDEQYELGRKIESLTTMIEDLGGQGRQSFVNLHKLPLPVVFCGDTLDHTDPVMRERIEREFFSMLSKQGQLLLYLKRTAKYFPMIEENLRAAGLPGDLKYLAVHESALLPKIRSRSHAVGMWQFMRSTGHLYKLKINRYIDERRHPEKATAAAMRLLRDLYKRFGSWPMVLAAYNGGENRIGRSIEDQNSNVFFDLSLPQETERYYFKIVATKIILSQADRFGFKLKREELFQPEETSNLQFTIHESKMSLDEIAAICDLTMAQFKDLNPQFVNSHIPAGSYPLKIPQDKYQSVKRNFTVNKSEIREFSLAGEEKQPLLLD